MASLGTASVGTTACATPALELARDDRVDRQHDRAAARLRRGHDLARRLDEIGLGQRLADVDAVRQQERIGHAAADDELVDLGERGA